MTAQERQKKAEEAGIIKNIGRRVRGKYSFSYRLGDTAEIVGWGVDKEHNRYLYFIKFKNDECIPIPAGDFFDQSSYEFID